MARRATQRERARQDAADGLWRDPETGKKWTVKGSAAEDWADAFGYCIDVSKQKKGSYRVPTLDEISALWHEDKFRGGMVLPEPGSFLWTDEVNYPAFAGDPAPDSVKVYYVPKEGELFSGGPDRRLSTGEPVKAGGAKNGHNVGVGFCVERSLLY
jgi:hypothetical protein